MGLALLLLKVASGFTILRLLRLLLLSRVPLLVHLATLIPVPDN